MECIIKQCLAPQAARSLPEALLYRIPSSPLPHVRFLSLKGCTWSSCSKYTYCGPLIFETRSSRGGLFFNILDKWSYESHIKMCFQRVSDFLLILNLGSSLHVSFVWHIFIFWRRLLITFYVSTFVNTFVKSSKSKQAAAALRRWLWRKSMWLVIAPKRLLTFCQE